jgi:diguanylate cyclase (GGDEF)-like protein
MAERSGGYAAVSLGSKVGEDKKTLRKMLWPAIMVIGTPLILAPCSLLFPGNKPDKDLCLDPRTPPPKARGIPRGTERFQAAVVVTAILLLTLHSRELLSVLPTTGLLLFALTFLSRSLPVALSREKPITFTAACVFAASLLTNGATAGWIALMTCVAYARLLRRGERPYAAFLGAQYALSAMAAHSAFSLLSGRPEVSARPDMAELGYVCAAMAAFVAANTLLVALGNLGTRNARRETVEALFRLHVLAYGASFPFAVLLVFAYRAFGLAAVPSLAVLVFICAHAVRMTVENRLLARQLWAVEQLGSTCASGVRTETPLSRFLELARELVAFDRGVLWLVEEGSDVLTSRAFFPEDATPPPLQGESEWLVSRAARRMEPILFPEGGRDGGQTYGLSTEAWLLYPVVLHGRCVGVAQFIRSAARPFDRMEMERLAVLVPHTAVAFESVRVRHLMHRYADMASTDGLTGLLNHRRSQELLREEFARAGRYRRPLAVLMVDVDSFKLFNDTYGHPQGDVLLTSVARIIRQSVRTVDHVGRYGGEEFIVILPETNHREACALAERIRKAVYQEEFPTGSGGMTHKTVSIGVAAYPEDGLTAAELVQIADDALYRAKRAGRNRVLAA